MKSITNNQLTFHNTIFHPVDHAGEIWFTSSELANALDYRKSDAVTQIYNRYHDEFTEKMSTTLKMSVVRKTGVVNIPVRIFSLRGAHLIAMFATTDKAKSFRRWVLNVLDEAAGKSPFMDIEMPLKWWYDNNVLLRDGNPEKPKRKYQSEIIQIHPNMLYGKGAVSPTLHLVERLEEDGYDLSACRVEVAVMRKMLSQFWPVVADVDAIRNVRRISHVKVIGERGEILLG